MWCPVFFAKSNLLCWPIFYGDWRLARLTGRGPSGGGVLFLVHGLFVPWTVRTMDCSYRPWTIRTMLRKDSLYSVSQTHWGFLKFRLGIFSPSFTGLLYVQTYGRLQIFVQLSPILTNLYHIKCNHPACVSADGGHFEHTVWWWSRLIWHNFVKVADN